MPNIGDIVRGKKIGYKNNNKWIWHACISCGKERWVFYDKDKPKNLRCKSCATKQELNPNWRNKGNRDERGYVRIAIRKDNFFYPMAINTGKGRYIFEHRLVMAEFLGRCLHTWEIVHHKNGIKYDNRIENLQLYSFDKHNGYTILEREIARLKNINKKIKEENKWLKRKLSKTSDIESTSLKV